METIRAEHVTFTYPLGEQPALKDINFSICSGQFILLCGKSGCGKSTLLRHLKKNLTPYGKRKGVITYCGEEVCKLDDRRSASEIGFVQQNPDNQIVTDKVWHELAFGLESLGLPNSTIKRRVAEMASYFGIQGWFRQSVNQLSGGQKQLLNLASIMAMQPGLLILDEPTSQLDPIAASEFLQTVYKINRDIGTTVLISEHRLEELFPMADQVMVMDQGRLIAFSQPDQIGSFLAGQEGACRHPMFYGLPSVMRIFSDVFPREQSPLTIREGRERLSRIAGTPRNTGAEPTVRKSFDLKKKENEVISMRDVWFKYDRDSGYVLRGLNLTVERGQWYCLLGGNGTGKSTTLKLMTGILKPQRGKFEKKSKALAMLPQNPQALFTEITAEEELLEALREKRIADQEKIGRVEQMLRKMELLHLRESNPYDLSGGEQQRLALGKILLLQPEILLLDEPTKGLDPFFKRTLAGILQELSEDGVTIFMVSHDVEFCAEHAHRCALFFDGDIVSEGTPKEFFPGNNFYTTVANRVARAWKPDALTCEEVSHWIKTMI